MTDRLKRSISVGVFSLGMVGGVFGCARAPGAIFVIGVNDSTPEVVALLLPVTLLPVCIVALWRRRVASLWLLLLALIWTVGMVYQRHYISNVRHFPPDSIPAFLVGEMAPAYFVLALAIFGLLTENAGWPKIVSRRQPAQDRQC
jgi:hypothetical protein